MICCEYLYKAYHSVHAVEGLRPGVPEEGASGLIEVSKVCTQAGILVHGTWGKCANTLAEAGGATRSLETEHPDIEAVFFSSSHATGDNA
ncbi:hypothetical protein J2129_002161 [Methanofollis sp. W23]|uniref:hypothetical protein n=1 Tax=Methanofollis sp. W23 TaxID=2817849 RepID=UPI001AE22C24|nr:hypothetical protein [Methanofollis sp. W23]MBP2146707.1 hypothetical protein [Methanofollis sp. W23]